MKIFAKAGLIRDITAPDIETEAARTVLCGGESPCREAFEEWLIFRRLL